ncbi:hypothetical protein LTR53_004676 [Teratosphaeriaceae sp. CCFEE 6253]|nr:hypothetical protein LTR53_004676 [Teratosphaeriaceae sp. CCFEE 6253]
MASIEAQLPGAEATDNVDSWTALLRFNLFKAVSIIDSDCEEASRSLIEIDEEVLNAPSRRSTRHELAQQIAARLYPGSDPDSLTPIIKYEKDIAMLRHMVLEQRREAITKATQRHAKFNWAKRILKQGPWDEVHDAVSLEGAPSLPMPVVVSDEESLAPFFAHLRNGGTHEPSSTSTAHESTAGIEPFYGVELVEFEKGVLYSDGRVDLCKMVTGPRNIGDLMESLKPNTFSKHFLLGNNIIGPVGAKAIANFVDEYPARFETWYLAGNCIDAASFSTLVDSMAKSDAITNVWLKRNPLGEESAEDVYRLIARTRNLRTLDLDQTKLGDAGVAKLFALLADHQSPLSLRHIYLNANGIGDAACKQIARFLASPACTLHSLFMSNNPVGDAGAAALASGLQDNTSLKRLSLQSCGLKNIKSLIHAASGLGTLDLGQSYATEDLGIRYNWITDENVTAIVDLIETAPQLKYLSLAYTPITRPQLNKVLAAVLKSNLVVFQAKPLVNRQQRYRLRQSRPGALPPRQSCPRASPRQRHGAVRCRLCSVRRGAQALPRVADRRAVHRLGVPQSRRRWCSARAEDAGEMVEGRGRDAAAGAGWQVGVGGDRSSTNPRSRS